MVVGDRDRRCPPARVRAVAAAILDATLAIISGAGHLSTIEQPEKVDGVLVPFIQDH